MKYFTCRCTNSNHGSGTGCSGTGADFTGGLCGYCIAEHRQSADAVTVELADKTEFKCPYCVLGKCSGGVDAKLGAVVTHSLPYCLVFEQLSGFEFLRNVNCLQALSAFRKAARA